MNGVDPYAYMEQVSLTLNTLTQRNEIKQVLDEMEYLFEVIPPELQDDAEKLIGLLTTKLNNAKD